eukprot:TRINITY_DN32365_c0_g1_i1.p1 TRINITY_DN32365_c0_g1~~TRINITY_DN32365_c0_g1_i1.p1  ORF type:complete len:367 (+),score=51.53 TRINITY_DN32365_c0_g1_i1:72-1172(+)
MASHRRAFIWVCLAVSGATSNPDTDVLAGTIEKRAVAATLGALVADAAVMPLHWIYDPKEIMRILLSKDLAGKPEFFPEPSSPFYKAPVGTQTQYGNQTLVLLRALAHTRNSPVNTKLDVYASYYYAEFKDQSVHAWTDASTLGFLKNYAAGLRWPACGSADNQANALAHMIPVVAATWCLPEKDALDIVEQFIRVTQNTDEAAAFGTAGARILRRLMSGASLLEAVNGTASALRTEPERLTCCDGYFADRLTEAFSVRKVVGHFEAVQLVGSSCMYPQNLVSGAHLLASMEVPNFVEGIRSTILAAGDQASRGMFLGASFGASIGSAQELPWVAQTRSAKEVAELAEAVASGCQESTWQLHEVAV